MGSTTPIDAGPTRRGGASPGWLWMAFAAASIAFFVALAVDSDPARLGFKALPVALLSVGVLLTVPRSVLRRIVGIGLAFGAAGDLLLELDAFVPGLVAFLIGHVLYVVAFLRLTNRPAIPVAVPYFVVGAVLTAVVAQGAGDLLVPVVAYAVVISAMGWRATALIGVIPGRAAWPFTIGAGLFIVSDSLIAINRFRTEIPGDAWWIMVTYLTAQALIALGATRSEAS